MAVSLEFKTDKQRHRMIFRRIWERYFLKEILKIFSLFIFCFYGLYIIIDYSSRSATHYAGKFTFLEMGKLYLFIFIQRMDILIPFALVVATVKTLCSLNVHNEIVALMSTGVKLKRLMRPFILVGLFFVALLYINEQFFLPAAYSRINFLKDKHNDDEARQDQYKNIQNLEVIDKGQIHLPRLRQCPKVLFRCLLDHQLRRYLPH